MSTPDARLDRPLRRDAERNRRRILEAAHALMSERGLRVSHDEIAAAADVAVGTVYRRFPTREELVLALFGDRVNGVVELARTALAVDDPWAAIETFMSRILSVHAEDRGLRELMTGSMTLARRAEAQIAPVVSELVERAHAAGCLRPGVRAQDLATINLMLQDVIDRARSVDPQLWQRMLAITLDGLRATHDQPLPGHAPTSAEFEQIMGD